MSDTNELSGWIGRSVVDVNGEPVGLLDNVFMDEDTEDAEWFSVISVEGEGPFLVPLAGASPQGEKIELIYTVEKVKGSPKITVVNDDVDDDQEAQLYTYYQD